MKKQLLLFGCFINWAICPLAQSSASAELTGIETDYDAKETLVNIKLSSRVPFEKITPANHETFFQIELPRVTLPKSGTFYESDGPYIKKIGAFQFSEDKTALRFFVRRDAAKLIKAMETDVLNDRFIISFDHKKLENLGISDHLEMDKPADVSKVLEKAEIRENILDPIHSKSETKNIQTSDLLTEKLQIVAAFLATLIFLGLLLYYISQKFRKARSFKDGRQGEIMKSLATYSLAPKKSLTLMQVGSQKILLGLSPDNISFLTNIEDQPIQRNEKSGTNSKGQGSADFRKLIAAAQNQKVKLKEPSQRAQIARTRKAESLKKRVPERKAQVSTLPPKKEEALEDVTSLIRKKLKDLPRL